MKPIEFIPPAAALVVAGVWLGSQGHSLSSLVEENTTLRERLESARHAVPEEEAGSGSPLLPPATKDGKMRKIDWKLIAQNHLQSNNGESVEDIRRQMQFQAMIQELSADEVVHGLEAIAGLDVPEHVKKQLEMSLINALAEKDPGLAVERLSQRLDDEGVSWQLGNTFRKWAEKEPAGAIAWMDQQLADGKFESKTLDGKSDLQLRCEAGLVAALLESDPAAARARVEALPEEQRSAIFNQGMFFRIKAGTELAVATMIRSTIPEGERLSTLGNTGGQLVHQGGYERVGEFLSKINASPEERGSIVSAAIRNQSHRFSDKPGELEEGVEKSRAWIQKEAPEALNRITGETLGNLASRNRFDEAAQLAEKYHAESGSDDVLVPFLRNTFVTDANRDRVLQLAGKISDEGKRNEVLEQLGQRGLNPPQSVPTR
ncbi:hypothetical protein [Luteolibacter luteus]|uniref:Uncharacterized protein n=1 Tax=Luteolibacter luteus TaxID=2728835 RepID=A0A858RJF6_9BACT|nr:hypothetical protein [Luteolibacter luteus]QJE96340.1 hypothetical protein HHL09_11265 [Luteolibacter luteus]